MRALPLRTFREPLALVTCCLALAVAADAHAFCRTTNVPFDASSEDPSVSGACWMQGMDIAWASSPVPYGVSAAGSKYFTAAQVSPIADQAFGAWTAVACGAGAPAVQTTNVGFLTYVPDGGTCATSTDCNAATNDVIAFDDNGWPYHDPTQTVALTTVTFGVRDGRIFEAYTEVNTAQHTFSLQAPPPPGGYDLLSVLTHEAGHALGLAHSTDPTAVMWAYNAAGHSALTPDDEAAICAAYPQRTIRGGGCHVATGGGGGAGGAASVGLLSLSLLVGLRRRSRHRSPGGRRSSLHRC